MATALLYALLCLIWGSTWLAIRIGLADLAPFWSLAARVVLALVFVLTLGWIRKTRYAVPSALRGKLILVSLLLYPINYGLVYWGEQYVTSGLTAVVFSCMPFFVAMLSWKMLPNERPGLTSVAGLLVGFCGLITIYWDQLSLGDTQRVLGMAAISFSALVSGYASVSIRRDLGKIPPVALTMWTLLAGALVIPVYALGLEGLDVGRITVPGLSSIVYLSVVGSGLAFVVYFRLLSQLSALTMSLITFITPIVALTLGALFDQEILTLRTEVGIGMVLVGVLLATRKAPATGAKKTVTGVRVSER